MISEADIQAICRAYNLGKHINVQVVNEGVLNDNYIFDTDSGKYFIKSVREKMHVRLPEIHGIESWMKSEGIPAIAMMLSADGSIFVKGEKDVYTVYPYVESDRRHIYSLEDYGRMGAMLGRIHLAGGKKLPETLPVKTFGKATPETILSRLTEFRKKIIEKEKQDELDRRFLAYIDFKLSLFERIEIPPLANDTLTHGDYQAGNILFDEKSREIIGICDWEKAEYGPRAYELARSLFYICFQYEDSLDQALKTARSFLAGYRFVNQISNEEITKGIKMRISKMVYSAWLEDMYYNQNSTRANHFVENEMRIMDLAYNKNLFELLDEILD